MIKKNKFNWYPGHIKKTKIDIKNKIKNIDVIIEILDARIPITSKNDYLEKIIDNKMHIILLNKKDLSSKKETKKWIKHFNKNNKKCISVNLKENFEIKNILNIFKYLKDIFLKKKKRKKTII